MSEQLRQAALDFHEFPIPGKIEVTPTKSLATQRDLALAYSPGVAEPCLEIEKDPAASYNIRRVEIWSLLFLMVQRYLVLVILARLRANL